MKKDKWIYLPAAAAAMCMYLSFAVSDMGTLWGYVLEAGVLVFLGLFALIAGIRCGLTAGKKDKKFMAAAVLAGCVCLFFGGSNLVKAGIDAAQGPVTVLVKDCRAEEQTSLKQLHHSYYINGRTSSGEYERFQIDRDTYYQYCDQPYFSVNLLYWKNSGVVKEIQQ